MNGITVFPWIIAGGDYSREGDYPREVIISNIAHWKLCPKYLFYFPIKSKIFHSIDKYFTQSKRNFVSPRGHVISSVSQKTVWCRQGIEFWGLFKTWQRNPVLFKDLKWIQEHFKMITKIQNLFKIIVQTCMNAANLARGLKIWISGNFK